MRRILGLLILVPCAWLHAADWSLISSNTVVNAPEGLTLLETSVRLDRDVHIKAALFNARKSAIRIIDQPGPDRAKMGEALPEAGCVAGVNGGYFHPDYRPSGLLISDGKEVHPFQKADLLSGVLVRSKTKTQIIRSGDYAKSSNITDAIQAGPFLVDAGKAVAGLEDKKVARRTVVATDGQDQFALIVISDLTTLAEAAEILATLGLFPDFKIQKALNLDGGSSSGFWVKTDPLIYMPEFKIVRDFVGVMPGK